MPNRGAGGVSYRYGFNGKETGNDVKGIGNEQDYGMRIYDPRLGRFLSVDPLSPKFPNLSPYPMAGNTPIQAVDLDGGEPIRPKSLVFSKQDLGFLNRQLSSKVWSYYSYVPAESEAENATLIKIADSYGVIWDYETYFGRTTQTNLHVDNLVWVEYNGTFYNMTKLANRSLSEKDFENAQSWEEYWETVQDIQDNLTEISEKTAMAMAAGQMVGGLSAVARAFRNARIYSKTVRDKLNNYLLEETHPVGGTKAKWFREALGFTKKNWEKLAKQIVFDATKAVAKEKTKYGQMFEQVIEINGANGRRISVQFNFIQKNGENFVRLVGAIPSKKP